MWPWKSKKPKPAVPSSYDLVAILQSAEIGGTRDEIIKRAAMSSSLSTDDASRLFDMVVNGGLVAKIAREIEE